MGITFWRDPRPLCRFGACALPDNSAGRLLGGDGNATRRNRPTCASRAQLKQNERYHGRRRQHPDRSGQWRDQTGNGSDTQPTIGLISQYIKDLSVENPNAPKSYQWTDQPQIDVQFNIQSNQIDDEMHEVALKVTCTAKAPQGTAYIVEATYCGLIGIRNVPEAQSHAFLFAEAPRILFPFAPPHRRRCGPRCGLCAADARSDRLRRPVPAADGTAPPRGRAAARRQGLSALKKQLLK